MLVRFFFALSRWARLVGRAGREKIHARVRPARAGACVRGRNARVQPRTRARVRSIMLSTGVPEAVVLLRLHATQPGPIAPAPKIAPSA